MEEHKTPNPNLSEEINRNNVVKENGGQRGRGLSNVKPEIQRENFSVQNQKQPEFDREGYEKRMDSREQIREERNNQKATSKKKIDKPNTKIAKAPVVATIAKGAGKKAGQFGLKLIPYVGTGIMLYEGYELTKDAYEYLKESPDLQKELQELHEQYPDEIPTPPSLEDINETSFFSIEEKENIKLAMETDKKEISNPFAKMEQNNELAKNELELADEMEGNKLYDIQSDNEAKKVELDLNGEEKENIALAMNMEEKESFESFPEIEQLDEVQTPDLEIDNSTAEQDMYAYQIDKELNELGASFSDEDKGNIALAMADIEYEQPEFSDGFDSPKISKNLLSINDLYSSGEPKNELLDLSFYGESGHSGGDSGGEDSGSDGGGGGDD